jgi:lysozyme family protein
MTAFEVALAQLYGFEGGFANNPLDHGGRTFRGVTQISYNAWRLARKLPIRPVEEATDAEITALYREVFWDTAGCDQLPVPLAIVVFDMAVNSNPINAKRTLQRALGVKDDGVIGPATIEAAKKTPDAVLLFLEARGKFIASIIRARSDQVEFLAGWITRLLRQAWTNR